MNSAEDIAAARGLLVRVVDTARKDLQTAMRRARRILRRPRGAHGPLPRITFDQVQAIHWLHDRHARPMGFQYVVDQLEFDAEKARAHCLAGLDMDVLRAALRVQFANDCRELVAWLEAGGRGVNCVNGMFQEAA